MKMKARMLARNGRKVILGTEQGLIFGEQVQEGMPMGSKAVYAKPCEGEAGVYELESVFPDAETPAEAKPSPAAKAHKGPARVTNKAYREGYDAIFSKMN